MISSKTPTKAQKDYWDYLAGLGCTACRLTDQVAIHHLTGIGGSKKVRLNGKYTNIGHWAVIPLCPQCHQYGDNAIHKSKSRFRELYGTEIDILQGCYDLHLDQTGNAPFSTDILRSIYEYLYLSYNPA